MSKKFLFLMYVFFVVYDLWAMIATAAGWMEPEALHQSIGFYFAFSYWLESAYDLYKEMKSSDN